MPLWATVGAAGLAATLVYWWARREIANEKCVTFGGALAALVHTLATADSPEAIAMAAWGLSTVRGGMDAALIQEWLRAATLLQQQRSSGGAATADVCGEHGRHFVQMLGADSEVARDLLAVLLDPGMNDPIVVAESLGDKNLGDVGLAQMAVEGAIVAHYQAALRTTGATE